MQSPSQNITTNKPTPSFLQAGCPPIAQPTVSEHGGGEGIWPVRKLLIIQVPFKTF